LTTPNLVLKNSPSIQLKRLSSDQSFTFDQSTKLNSSFVSASLSQNDYEVEFLLQDVPAGSSGVFYSIMKPFTLFGIFLFIDFLGNTNITGISPSLVVAGQSTKIEISGTNFVVSSKVVDLKFTTPNGKVETAVGYIITDKLIEVQHTFQTGNQNGATIVEVSFDDKNSYTKSNSNITLFGMFFLI
jgi:hypothetical protein